MTWTCDVDDDRFALIDNDDTTYLVQYADTVPDDYTSPLADVISDAHYAVEVTTSDGSYSRKLCGVIYSWTEDTAASE